MGEMRSFKVTGFGAPLEEVVEDAPKPIGSEVLLRVAACGVCHSDVHLRDGYFDLGPDGRLDLSRGLKTPFTLGHEVAGAVVAVGPDAAAAPEAVAVGDARLVYPWIGCGACATCRAGDEQLCRAPRNIGIHAGGGYSDHVMVPHPRYLLSYDGIPAAEACTYACSGLTAYGALKKVGRLGSGDPLVVIGAGGVGLAGVRLAVPMTGAAAMVAERAAARREAAVAAGAVSAFDPMEDGAVRRFVKETGGAAAVVDFVGSAETARFGFDILRKGARLIVVGLCGGGLTVPVPHFPLREVAIAGSYVGSLQDLRDLVALARAGKAGRPAVATHRLHEAEDLLCALADGRITGRAVLVP
jgi:D-arabinose 1-dehydrogenase-like Zn-dependent alcohol dehydrogenase